MNVVRREASLGSMPDGVLSGGRCGPVSVKRDGNKTTDRQTRSHVAVAKQAGSWGIVAARTRISPRRLVSSSCHLSLSLSLSIPDQRPPQDDNSIRDDAWPPRMHRARVAYDAYYAAENKGGSNQNEEDRGSNRANAEQMNAKRPQHPPQTADGRRAKARRRHVPYCTRAALSPTSLVI